MIKKVKTKHLRIGAFIHDLNYSAEGGNVFIRKTLIKSERAIDIIKSWGIEEVFIDTDRGLDIEPDRDPRLDTLGRPPSVPLGEEIQIARSIKEDAAFLMRQNIELIEQDKGIDLGGAYRLVGRMQESIGRNKDALLLLSSIKNKDEYTLLHSISVSSLVIAFCNACNFDHEVTVNMGIGALFHDIGKTLIPDHILNKPGRLDAEEFAVIKRHAEYSAKILERTRDLPPEVFDIALHHHERCNGSGYPHGLMGDTIELGSKIVSICDIFDACTSNRCYKNGNGRVKALKELYDDSSRKLLDEALTFQFIRFIGVYPIGTVVKLEDQRIGVVVEATANLLQPVVRLFYDDARDKRVSAQEINLSRHGLNISGYESPASWRGEKRKSFQQHGRVLAP